MYFHAALGPPTAAGRHALCYAAQTVFDDHLPFQDNGEHMTNRADSQDPMVGLEVLAGGKSGSCHHYLETSIAASTAPRASRRDIRCNVWRLLWPYLVNQSEAHRPVEMNISRGYPT